MTLVLDMMEGSPLDAGQTLLFPQAPGSRAPWRVTCEEKMFDDIALRTGVPPLSKVT